MRPQARLAVRATMALLVLFGGQRIFSAATGPSRAEVRAAAPDGQPTRATGRRVRRTTTTTVATTVAPPTTPATTRATTPPPPATTTATTATPTTPATTAPPTTPATTAPPTTPATTAPPTTAPPTTPATTAPAPARFATLPPGSALPSGATCAGRVRAAAETRAVNATYNQTVGTKADAAYPRVDGQYRGSTDQVLQWAACKWGIDEDVVRAQIAVESWWSMLTVGDNGESFGLGQVRVPYHPSAFVDDNAKRSSAYNVDYTYAVFRSCFEGEMTWLNTVERGSTYAAGDLWGCVGVWFSGRWHTPAAEGYIAKVQDYLNQRIWTTPNFLAA